MDKDKVKEIIVDYLDTYSYKVNVPYYTFADDLADLILSKIPDDIVIVEGKLSGINVILPVHKYEIYFSSTVSTKIGTIPNLIGKNIKLKLEVLE